MPAGYKGPSPLTLTWKPRSKALCEEACPMGKPVAKEIEEALSVVVKAS